MEEDIKIDAKFKQAFNLGYRLAKELNLKSHIFQDQEKAMSSNPMHLGTQQFIDEAELSKSNQQDKSENPKKGKGKSLDEGLGL